MSNLYNALKRDSRLIWKILRRPDLYEGWTLQGFGMLRLYLTKEIRLHVWNHKYAVKNVSVIHDHPWDFSSYIVSGHIENTRFEILPGGSDYWMSLIKCGAGGGQRSEPVRAPLYQQVLEAYGTGEEYHQKAKEVHMSVPVPGTVTIVERTFSADTEHARVFWPSGDWVSAEPRPATPSEVRDICQSAFELARCP